MCGTECHSASAAVDQLHTAFQSLGSRLSVATLADGVLHCAPHPATLSVVRHTVVLDGGHPCVCLRCNFRFDGHRADHVLFALPSLAWISSLLVCFRARIKSHAAPTDHKNQFFSRSPTLRAAPVRSHCSSWMLGFADLLQTLIVPRRRRRCWFRVEDGVMMLFCGCNRNSRKHLMACRPAQSAS